MNYRTGFFIFLIFIGIVSLNAQETKKDSLLQILNTTEGENKIPLYLSIAEKYSRPNKDTALMYADSAIELSISKQNESYMADAYAKTGEIYFNNDEFDRSMEYLLLAKESYIQLGNKSKQADMNNYLSMVYYYKNDYEKALDYAQESIELAEDLNSKELKAEALWYEGRIYNRTGKGEEAIEAYHKALEIYEELGERNQIANILNGIGSYYSARTDYQNAIEYYERTLKIHEELGNERGLGIVMNNLGNQHLQLGNFDEAFNYYQQASEIFREIDFDRGTAATLTGMAIIYESLGQFNSVLDVYQEVLDIRRKQGDKYELANTLSNIAVTYSLMLNDSLESRYGSNYQDSIYIKGLQPGIEFGQKSIEYNLQALNLRREIGHSRGVAITLANLGTVYQSLGNFDKANEFFTEWMELPEEVQDDDTKVSVNIGLGRYALYEEDFSKAIIYFNNAYRLANEINKKTYIREAARNLSDLYEKTNNFERALEYFKRFHNVNNSLIQENTRNQIHEMQVKYETEAQEIENEILRKNQLINETKLKNSRRALIASIIILLVFAGLVIQLIRQNNLRRKANEELAKKNQLIIEQTQEIKDSIQYASRIQNALLPPENYMHKLLPEQFLIYRPRDIVSGDYYWMKEKGDKVVTIVADCTGHGVPGAFMSMLGIAFLNEIFSKHEKLSTDLVLNELRSQVMTSLHQTGKEGESQDGMDVSLFILDRKKMELEYSGANNSLVIFRNGEMIELKADKMPIGIHTSTDKSFSRKEIKLEKNDMLYAFSDGYPDQFGGPKGKKFMIRKFKALLGKIHNLPVDEQKDSLERTLDDWMADTSQIDDILVMGVRV